MNPKIIAERDSTLILFDNNKVKTVPNTPYNQVKYRDYKGERIFYQFNDDIYIQETYDNGIFNAFMNDETIQMRNSNDIVQSILEHKKDNNANVFVKLFKSQYFLEKKSELMREVLHVFGDRVVTHVNKDKSEYYVIDDRFMVNDKGVSHYKDNLGTWSFLCTVAQGNLSKMTINTKVGDIELGSTELTIMGKIGFLLSPDIHDNVFFEQLTDKLKDTLKAEIEAGV